MVQPCDYVCKKSAYVRADVPFLFQKLFVVNGIGSDYPVEKSLLISFVKKLYCISRKERKADCRNDLCGSLVVKESHGLEECASGSKHVVCKEGDLTLYVSQKLDALDVRVLCILGYD